MEVSELNRITDAIEESMDVLSHEFKQAADRSNANISRIVKDIARVFSEQRSELAQILTASEQNITETEKLNSEIKSLADAFQESISIQTSIHGDLKNVSEGIGSLSSATEALNESIAGSGGNSVTGLLGGVLRAFDYLPGAFKLAVSGLTLGAAGGSAYNLMGGGGGGDAQLTGAGGSYNAEKAAALIRKVGGNEQEATVLGAISQPESTGNPNAHNHNPATGDNSYGLWQINMLDKLGPERRAKYGLTSNEQLYNPETNARIALQMLREAHGVPKDWTTWKHGKHESYMQAARAGATGKVTEEAATTPKADATATSTPSATPNLAPSTTPVEPMKNTGGIISSTAKEGKGQDAGKVVQSQTGIRNLPINDKLMAVLQKAAAAAGVTVNITSGAQPNFPQGPRTGSTRHDIGVGAADLDLYSGGRVLSDNNPQDIPLKRKFVEAAAAAGATGIGAAEGYMGPTKMHVGFGAPAVWGTEGKSGGAASWLSGLNVGSGTTTPGNESGTGTTPGSHATPVSGGNMMGEQSISQQAMAAAQPTPINPEAQEMINASSNSLIGGAAMGGMGGMMGMMGGMTSMLPPLAASSFGPSGLQDSTNNVGMLLNNNEREEITNQLKESAVEKQAQAEVSQEQVAAPVQQQVNLPDFGTASSMHNSEQGINYNHDTGVPEWASKFFLGWHETNKFKTWG